MDDGRRRNRIVLRVPGTSESVDFPLREGEALTVGRSDGNVVVLPDEAVSRKHLQVFFEPGRGYVLTDLGSANGTRVNGKTVREAVLADRDVIRAGSCELAVHLERPPATGRRPAPAAFRKKATLAFLPVAVLLLAVLLARNGTDNAPPATVRRDPGEVIAWADREMEVFPGDICAYSRVLRYLESEKETSDREQVEAISRESARFSRMVADGYPELGGGEELRARAGRVARRFPADRGAYSEALCYLAVALVRTDEPGIKAMIEEDAGLIEEKLLGEYRQARGIYYRMSSTGDLPGARRELEGVMKLFPDPQSPEYRWARGELRKLAD